MKYQGESFVHYILPKYKKNVDTFILNLNYVLMEMFDCD